MLDQPFVIQNMRDMQAVFKAETNACDKLDADLQELEDAMLTPTAPLWLIWRKEEAYGLKPSDGETLEERRYRVYTKEHEKIPFTVRTLRRMLDSLCGGAGHYTLTVNQHDKEVRCLVELRSRHMLQDIYELLDRVLPADLYISSQLNYNTWQKVGRFTWGNVNERTWLQLREGELDATNG